MEIDDIYYDSEEFSFHCPKCTPEIDYQNIVMGSMSDYDSEVSCENCGEEYFVVVEYSPNIDVYSNRKWIGGN